MGTGASASAEDKERIERASAADMESYVAGLPEEQRAELEATLAKRDGGGFSDDQLAKLSDALKAMAATSNSNAVADNDVSGGQPEGNQVEREPQNVVSMKIPSGKYLCYVFDDYSDKCVVENSDVNLHSAPFEVTMLVTVPCGDYAYGILFSHDRAFDAVQQLRLEMYESGRVCLIAGEAIPGGYGHSGAYGDGDKAGEGPKGGGWSSDLITPEPLRRGQPVRIKVIRDAAGDFALFLDEVLVSRACALGGPKELCNHSAPAFRIGSRFGPGEGRDIRDPFPGTITDARLLVLA